MEKEKRLDYLKENFHVTLFIKEAGYRLMLPDVTITTACVLYHKFVSRTDCKDFDLNVLGCTALYLAGKAEETPCRLRDVINISYSTLNKDKTPIQIATKYWELRDSVVRCELLFLRVLGFQVTVDNPHKYMLHYLKSLEDWTEERTWQLSQLPQICWNTLNDSFHTNLCIKEHASRVAVAVIYFGLSCTGLKIPSETARKEWWQVFCPEIQEEDVHKLVHAILDVYEFEHDRVKLQHS